MAYLFEDGAKGWWRSLLTVALAFGVPASVMLVVAFAGPFLTGQVLLICGLWCAPLVLHILVLVSERSFWHYCERANSSLEHAQEQFKKSLANIEMGLGMCVKGEGVHKTVVTYTAVCLLQVPLHGNLPQLLTCAPGQLRPGGAGRELVHRWSGCWIVHACSFCCTHMGQQPDSKR